MSKRITKLLLEDIFECIEFIELYTKDKTFEQFINDRKTYEATLFNFHIIGEAASQVPKDFKEENALIKWAEVVAFRNKLIHEYFGTSNQIIWDTIKLDLPELKTQIKFLIDKEL